MSNIVNIEPENEAIKKMAKAMTDFKTLCNEEPETKEWNKFSKQNYVPISFIEMSLDELLYLGWHTEVIKWEIQLNSCCVHLRLHYTNPVTGKECWTDGLGACPIQTNLDSKPMDISNIKSAGIQMALPAAKSYALKDAAEQLGKVFGRDIARNHIDGFNPIVKTEKSKSESYAKCVQAWEQSKKDQATLDRYLIEAKKQGIYEQFLAYVKGKK